MVNQNNLYPESHWTRIGSGCRPDGFRCKFAKHLHLVFTALWRNAHFCCRQSRFVVNSQYIQRLAIFLKNICPKLDKKSEKIIRNGNQIGPRASKIGFSGLNRDGFFIKITFPRSVCVRSITFYRFLKIFEKMKILKNVSNK